MTDAMKAQIGHRLREKREQAGYTREKLGELCSLSARFLANIELGDSTFSLDSLITVCRVLSCSSDFLLFGECTNIGAWSDTVSKLEQLNIKYKLPVDKAIQGLIEVIITAEGCAVSSDPALGTNRSSTGCPGV